MFNKIKSLYLGRYVIFVILFCFSSVITAQNPEWGSVKETNINVGSALSFDIFTNQDGNHIIVQESNSLKYYKMNLNGQAGSPITLESVSVVSPSITGNETRLYVVYRRSNETFIRTRVSTNGGSSWSYLSQTPSNSNGSNIESVVSNNNLHISFQISNSVYYSRKYILDGSAWTSRYTVSDTETGTAPRIAAWKDADEDKVYFIYRNSLTTGKFREYNITANQWGSKYTGYSLNPSNLSGSAPVGFTVGSDYVYYYYSYSTTNPNEIYFQYRILTKTGSLIWESYAKPRNETFRVHTTTTFDGASHTAYWDEFYPGLYRQKNLSTQFIAPDLFYWNNNQQAVFNPPVNLSSAGNEVHVIWKDNLGSNNGNNLRYRWENLNPIAPQNLTMSSHNNHPKLVWQKNPEQDVDYYRIYRKKGTGNYTLLTTVSVSLPTEYVDNEETVCNPPPGAHCENEVVAKYYITAVDLTSKVSLPSNEVEAILQGTPPSKPTADNPFNGAVYAYSLSQNYPNPFNPTTTISYSIKSPGLVSLKVYDILGTEVASLVNENQEAGNYSVEFNAYNLTSGIYFYTLTSGNFVETKKLILLK